MTAPKIPLSRSEIVIYTAGKTWAAEGFRKMRDEHGYNVNAHWIDISNTLSSPQDSFDYENQDFSYLEKMWDHGCKMDCCMCDMGIVYATEADGNMHSGSLVEIGHITASFPYLGIQKPIYLIGSCQSFEKMGNSDRGFMHQRVFHKLPTNDIEKGFAQATEHYRQHYTEDWFKWRQHLNANAMVRAMRLYCDEQSQIAVEKSQQTA